MSVQNGYHILPYVIYDVMNTKKYLRASFRCSCRSTRMTTPSVKCLAQRMWKRRKNTCKFFKILRENKLCFIEKLTILTFIVKLKRNFALLLVTNSKN